MDEEKKKKIVSLFKAASKPRRAPQPVGPGTVIVVNASGQAQAAGRDIHNYHYERPPRAPRVTVMPGAGVIDENQARRLKTLVEDWVSTNNCVRRTQITHAGAWSALNKRAGVTSYRLIPAAKFHAMEKWLQQQLGRLGNMASAPRKDDSWRGKKIGAIKARCKNQLGDEFAYKQYIQRRFGAASLSELATDELQATYAYVMGKKPAREP